MCPTHYPNQKASQPGTESRRWLLLLERPNEQSRQPTPSLPLQSRGQWDPVGRSCKRKPAAGTGRGAPRKNLFSDERQVVAGTALAQFFPPWKPEWFQNISQPVDNHGSLSKEGTESGGKRKIRFFWRQYCARPAEPEPRSNTPWLGDQRLSSLNPSVVSSYKHSWYASQSKSTSVHFPSENNDILMTNVN